MPSASQAIQQQMAELARQLQLDYQVQDQYSQTGQQALQQEYNQLAQQLGGNLQGIQQTYNQGGKEIAGSYNAAQGAIGRNAQFANSLFQGNELAGDVSKASYGQLMSDLAASRAGSTASYNTEKSGGIGAARMAIGDARKDRAGAVKDLVSQIGGNKFELQSQFNEKRSDLQARLQEVLAQEEAQRRAEALERERLQLEREQAAEARRQFEASLGLDREKFNYDRQVAEREANPFVGREGVERYSREKGLNYNQDQMIFDIIRRAELDAAGAGADPVAFVKDYVQRADLSRVKNKKNRRRLRNRLDTLADIYYGRYQP